MLEGGGPVCTLWATLELGELLLLTACKDSAHSPAACDIRTFSSVSAMNGGVPLSRMYRMTPRDHTSASLLYSRFST